MPIPKAGKEESKQTFISRCIAKLTREESERFPKRTQRAAICYSEWNETPDKRQQYEQQRKKKQDRTL